MPLGPYSICPGGSGKKIKFCCPDLAGELQKIERMIDGDQPVACLKHIEQLESKHPDQACLLAAKTLVLRTLGRAEEAADVASGFLEKHPDNPIALAESAMAAAVDDGPAGMDLLARAIAAGDDQIHGRVYEAMGMVGRVLAVEGHLPAARTLALLQLAIRRDDRQALELLMQLNAAPNVPLVMKDDRTLDRAPKDAPFREAFQEALALADRAHWLEAADRFEAVAEQAPDSPAVWRNLALMRSWLADAPRSVDALRKYASLDVPLEDAVEAETLALCLSTDPLGDHLDVFSLRYALKDADAVQEALGAAPRAARIQINPAALADDAGPPPAAVFALFDHPAADPAASASLDSIPRVLGQALLFGRETDAAPRLEVLGLVSTDRLAVESLLAEVAGDQFDGEPSEEVSDRISATQEMLVRNFRLPEGISREQFRDLTVRYVTESLLEKWPKCALGFLDGKSPEEAAANGNVSRVRVLSAVMLVESWLEQAAVPFDANRLRSRLGLPELGPIDPLQTPVDRLPLVRLARVEVDKLSDDALRTAYRRAVTFGARPALRRLAGALVGRPGVAEPEERQRAFVLLTRSSEDTLEALSYIDRARQEAEGTEQSCASWDLLEMSVRFERREGAEVSRLMNHLQSRHLQEPGVAQALTELLIGVGAIHPDGTPAAPADEGPALVVPGQTGAEPDALWTPEGQKPAGEKSKIWTPGMD